ncbi:L-carnitine dehydrogenase [bacterium HR40]|nr:L-carnitine dehydrogenase [bacterium HR40]
MRTIAVIGAGLIGRAWAVTFARGGFRVRLQDPDPEQLERARGFAAAALAELHGCGLLAEEPEAVLARIEATADLGAAVAEAELVQENAPERLEVKCELFAELDRLAPEKAVLASSSSAIPASCFTEPLAGRARCLVAHPVNPPHLVPLVELVPAPWTESDTLARAREILQACGMVPVELRREIEGFVLNRLQGALLREAFALVAEGYITVEDCDRVVRDGLGLRWAFMGPFETIDLNAPGGVRDYCARYGPAYARMWAGGPQTAAWDEALVARIEAERRRQLPAEALAARARWRDQRLVALLAHRRQAEREFGA